MLASVKMAVSIPESGFCLFGPRMEAAAHVVEVVSIPESGFCLFGHTHEVLLLLASVMFQSLSRDSVCLDCSRSSG